MGLKMCYYNGTGEYRKLYKYLLSKLPEDGCLKPAGTFKEVDKFRRANLCYTGMYEGKEFSKRDFYWFFGISSNLITNVNSDECKDRLIIVEVRMDAIIKRAYLECQANIDLLKSE